jgi:hypothetical protein
MPHLALKLAAKYERSCVLFHAKWDKTGIGFEESFATRSTFVSNC